MNKHPQLALSVNENEEPLKLKIVFVENSLPRAGGAEQVLYDLILRLDRERIEPVLVCLHDLGELGECLRTAGCQTYENVAKGRLDPRNIHRLAAILRTEQADIVYTTDAFHNMVLGRLAAVVAGTPKTMLAFHVFDTVLKQTEDISAMRRMIMAASDRLLHNRFHSVIALAESHKQYLVSEKGISAQKIAVIHNGIDHHRFAIEPSVADARSSFGLPTNQHLVGIVAALRPCKAHEMFLRAAAKVREQEPSTEFVIAGTGPEQERLEQLSRDLAIEKQVHFLGQVSNVPMLLHALDVSVLTSFSEAFPLALLESMASQCPVVASDVGSVGEIVDDGVNGFRVPFGEVDQFAEGILKLLRDPELAKQFGAAGRKKVEEMFTVEHMVRETESLFYRLAGSSGGAS